MDMTNIKEMFDSIFPDDGEEERGQITDASCRAAKEDRKETGLDCLNGFYSDAIKNHQE